MTATGTPAPTFSESGPLPSGVTLSPAGLLSGTATESGSFPITLTATNVLGSTAPQPFTLSVVVLGLQITTPTVLPPTEAPGSSYGLTFTYAGAKPGATFKWKGTGFPKGLKLGKTGVLAGTISSKVAAGTVYSPVVTLTETVKAKVGKQTIKTVIPVSKTFSLTIG